MDFFFFGLDFFFTLSLAFVSDFAADFLAGFLLKELGFDLLFLRRMGCSPSSLAVVLRSPKTSSFAVALATRGARARIARPPWLSC